jgi:hypothetical protein
MIDHKNRVRSDNSQKNMRLANYSQQRFNSQPRKCNATGITGIRIRGRKFVAVIGCLGKRYYLNSFDTLAEAAGAREAAERLFFGEFRPMLIKKNSPK